MEKGEGASDASAPPGASFEALAAQERLRMRAAGFRAAVEEPVWELPRIGEMLRPSNMAPWPRTRQMLNRLLLGWSAHFGYGSLVRGVSGRRSLRRRLYARFPRQEAQIAEPGRAKLLPFGHLRQTRTRRAPETPSQPRAESLAMKPQTIETARFGSRNSRSRRSRLFMRKSTAPHDRSLGFGDRLGPSRRGGGGSRAITQILHTPL